MPAPSNGLCTTDVGSFRITRRGRFWQVYDREDRLVVTAVYKVGALEVVRRLLPPDLRSLADSCPKRIPSGTGRVRQASRSYDPHQCK